MARKLSLAAGGSLALVALAAAAPSAYANTECTNNALPPGIYPPSNPSPGAQGTFDLANTPQFGAGQAKAVDGFIGGALLCGDNEQTMFYKSGDVTTPQKGERIHCASPSFTVCPDLHGGGVPLPDGAYYGSALADATCEAQSILCLFGNLEFHNIPTTVKVNYGDPACTPAALACATASATPIPGITCTSSNILRARGRIAFVGDAAPHIPGNAEARRAAARYVLTISQPVCPGGLNPTYFTAIRNLTLCDYANPAPGATTCGDGTDPTMWQQRNGIKGTHTYGLDTQNITMPNQTATASITWT